MFASASRKVRRNRSQNLSFKRPLRFERLEDRSLLAAIITVDSTADSDTRDDFLTLREAILVNNRTLAVGTLTTAEQAHVTGTPTNADADTINFNIAGAGVQTITVTSDLPPTTEAVQINGYTQSDARANTNGPGLGSNAVLRIQIVPDQARSLARGLRITGGGSTIRGLVINGFHTGIDLLTNGGNTVAGNFIGTTPEGLMRPPGFDPSFNAVLLQSSNNTIGGTAPADRNLLAAAGSGVHVPINPVAEASNNVIQGNFIGTNAAGTSGTRSNFDGGIYIESGSGNQIGGAAPGEGNLITGLKGIFILLGGPRLDPFIRNSNGGHIIQGNLIGTDLTGVALLSYTNSGNQPGLGIEQSPIFIVGLGHFDPTVNPLPITIGGTSPGAGNVLAGSFSEAMSLSYPSGFTAATFIQGNLIGTDRSGVVNFGNQTGGINLGRDMRNVTIAGNTIAFNGERFNSAVTVPSGETGILIVDNAIHGGGDGNPGIIRSPDVGSPPPTLTSVSVAGSTTTVQGTVSGAVGSNIRVDLYANAPQPSPITIQGQTPVRTIQVLIGANGTGAFNTSFPTVPLQPLITATATSPTNTTSPFSAPLQPQATAPTVTINQAAGQADPTTSGPIQFTVVFSAPVTGFAASDVSLGSSTVGGTLVAGVSGSGTTYTVSVTGMNGSGTVIASIGAGAAVNASNTPSTASTSTDNTVTFATVVVVAPSVTINQAAGQADPTASSPIQFTVVFSTPVTGFTASDVSLAGSTVGGTLVAGVSGNGTTYTVSVSGMTGNGTVVASILAGAAINDSSTASAASTSTDNTVTFATAVVAPTVTINQSAGQADPTSSGPIQFTVVFSTPVTGFAASDVSFAGSTVGDTLAASVLGTGTSYTVSVTGMTGSGTVIASIGAGAAVNASNTPSAASTSTDNTVTVAGPVGQATILTITLVGRQAKYKNEFGLYFVDDAAGRIGTLLPGDPGYARAAIARTQAVFTTRDKIGAKRTVNLPAGTFYGTYLVQNTTRAGFLARNPLNRLSLKPLMFFSFAAGNPDGFEHTRRPSATRIAFEDQTRGGDQDFNDSVVEIRAQAASIPTLLNPPPTARRR